jgi:Flp pilus assembly protein TadG
MPTRLSHIPTALRDATRRYLGDRRGATAAEFALVAPLIIMLMMGVIEAGRVVYTQTALSFAAQEGTRYAIVRDGQVTTEEIEAFAHSRMLGVVDGNLAVFTATAPVDPATNTSRITVQVNLDYQPWFPYFPNFRLHGNSSGFLAFPNS